MIRSGRKRRAPFSSSSKVTSALNGIGLRFDWNDVRLLDLKLRRILDYDDALVVGDRLGQVCAKVLFFPVPVPPLISIVFPL